MFGLKNNFIYALNLGLSRLLMLIVNIFITRQYGLEAISNFNSFLSANMLGAELINARKDHFYNTQNNELDKISIEIDKSFLIFILVVFLLAQYLIFRLSFGLNFISYDFFTFIIFLLFIAFVFADSFLKITGRLNVSAIFGSLLPYLFLLLILFTVQDLYIKGLIFVLSLPGLFFPVYFYFQKNLIMDFKLTKQQKNYVPWIVMFFSISYMVFFRIEDIFAPIILDDDGGYFVTARRLCFIAAFPLTAIFTFQAAQFRKLYKKNHNLCEAYIKKIIGFYSLYLVAMFLLSWLFLEKIYNLFYGYEYRLGIIKIHYLILASMNFPFVLFISRCISICNLYDRNILFICVAFLVLKIILVICLLINPNSDAFVISYIFSISIFAIVLLSYFLKKFKDVKYA